MLDLLAILEATPLTEPASWYEFLNALGPEKPGETKEWSLLFTMLRASEKEDLIEIDWCENSGPPKGSGFTCSVEIRRIS
jgi:hypothetical protein